MHAPRRARRGVPVSGDLRTSRTIGGVADDQPAVFGVDPGKVVARRRQQASRSRSPRTAPTREVDRLFAAASCSPQAARFSSAARGPHSDVLSQKSSSAAGRGRAM